MINTIELARQTHNVSLAQDINSIKKELSNTVQLHLFDMCSGKSIKTVSEKLAKLEEKLC